MKKKTIVILQPREIEDNDKLHGFIKTWFRKHVSLESAEREYKDFRVGGIFHAWKIVSISEEI